MVLLALLVHATPVAVSATDRLQEYTTRSWQTEDGLPHGYVLAALQTRDGYLWVGTRAGLFRFDGMRFTEIDIGPTNNLAIASLCEDRDGSLWVGLETHGLVRLQGQSLWSYGRTNGLPSTFVRAICNGKGGIIWLATKGGLARYQDGRFRTFTQEHGLAGLSVEAICEDPDGNLWVGTSDGLNCLKDGVVTATLRTNSGLPSNGIMSLMVDSAGKLWIGTTSGLAVMNSGKVEMAYDESNGLTDRYIRTLHEDRQGNLWIGTYGGLYRVPKLHAPKADLAPRVNCFPQLNSDGTAYDRVMTVFEDREANIWIGGRDGLSRLRTKPFTSLGKREGLSQNSATAVCEDGAGTLWVATWRGGLNRLEDERFLTYPPTNGLTSDLLLSLWPARDGSLWIGADHADGLYHFKDGAFTHLDTRHGLTNAAISVVYEDRATNLWIGTSRTLTLYKDGHFTDFTTREGLAGNIVKVILEDRAGSLWVGTTRGLSCRTGDKFVNFTTENGLSDNTITALYEDGQTNLWIGTASGGLHRFREGRFTTYTVKQGLFSNEALEILEDGHGYFWMSCQNGVYRIERKSFDDFDAGKISYLPCAAYGKDEGMAWVQCNGAAKPAGWKNRDGRLWFATTKGLAVAEPTINRNAAPPPVAIEEIVADKRKILLNQSTSTDPAAASTQAPILGIGTSAIQISPGRGELEFHYTALSFQAPEKNRFRYKLDGLDADWVDAESRREAFYTRVPPGHYRFRVMACNNNGVWNEDGASVEVVLLAHYWQTWWFWCLAVVTGIGAVGGSAGYLVRKASRRRLQRLEQQHALEKERARIARDIHDDLGSSLTRISMLSELAEADKANPDEVEHHVRKIAASARETVRSLDEIVWAISPEHDTWNSLVGYISEYANEFFAGTSVRCRLDIPMDLPALSLPSEFRHSLFLIIKEALNNSLKHAGATEVRIRVSEVGPEVEITVEDNGRGFDLEKVAALHRGSGLRNMRERAESLNGRICLESTPGQGTKLAITVPLTSSQTALAHE